MVKSSEKTFFGRFRKFLRSGDMFGVPVTLNYKGTPTFKTALGGTVSYLVYIVFVIIGALLAKKMIGKTSLNTNENNKVINLSEADVEMVYPLQNHMLFGFSYDTNNDDEVDNNIWFTFLDEYDMYDESTGQFTHYNETIETTYCHELGKILKFFFIKAFNFQVLSLNDNSNLTD